MEKKKSYFVLVYNERDGIWERMNLLDETLSGCRSMVQYFKDEYPKKKTMICKEVI